MFCFRFQQRVSLSFCRYRTNAKKWVIKRVYFLCFQAIKIEMVSLGGGGGSARSLWLLALVLFTGFTQYSLAGKSPVCRHHRRERHRFERD